jgi:hypothetical protein
MAVDGDDNRWISDRWRNKCKLVPSDALTLSAYGEIQGYETGSLSFVFVEQVNQSAACSAINPGLWEQLTRRDKVSFGQ